MTIDHLTFEKLKEVNEHWEEYWWARDLYSILGYSSYNEFWKTLYKSIIDCDYSKQLPWRHFQWFIEYMQVEKWEEHMIGNIKLSRYACYLIIQNTDRLDKPNKNQK